MIHHMPPRGLVQLIRQFRSLVRLDVRLVLLVRLVQFMARFRRPMVIVRLMVIVRGLLLLCPRPPADHACIHRAERNLFPAEAVGGTNRRRIPDAQNLRQPVRHDPVALEGRMEVRRRTLILV